MALRPQPQATVYWGAVRRPQAKNRPERVRAEGPTLRLLALETNPRKRAFLYDAGARIGGGQADLG